MFANLAVLGTVDMLGYVSDRQILVCNVLEPRLARIVERTRKESASLALHNATSYH